MVIFFITTTYFTNIVLKKEDSMMVSLFEVQLINYLVFLMAYNLRVSLKHMHRAF
jgi:hypothetical protein